MAKINFSKGEESINAALQRMRIKRLSEGLEITSQRAIDYFGLDNTTRHYPEDSVERLLDEDSSDQEVEHLPNTELLQNSATNDTQAVSSNNQQDDSYEEIGEAYDATPTYERLVKLKPRKSDVSQKNQEKKSAILIDDRNQEEDRELSPLVTLRKHILWLKLQGIEDRYERIGSTRAEIFHFRRQETLSSDDLQRINELINQAKAVKRSIQADRGHDCDDQLIENQQKYYKNKFLTVRERWLKL